MVGVRAVHSEIGNLQPVFLGQDYGNLFLPVIAPTDIIRDDNPFAGEIYKWVSIYCGSRMRFKLGSRLTRILVNFLWSMARSSSFVASFLFPLMASSQTR